MLKQQTITPVVMLRNGHVLPTLIGLIPLQLTIIITLDENPDDKVKELRLSSIRIM